jgi:predicted  nucleic acid-binding Zn-ribbon protein
VTEKTARCLACREEFSEEEIERVSSCPKCGSKGVPCDPRKDTTIRINPHELRVLTIWASNWADKHCDASATRSLKGILGAIHQQLPDVSLTMREEFLDLAKVTGSDVTVIQGGEVETFKGSKPS